jgi:hypothetical protein
MVGKRNKRLVCLFTQRQASTAAADPEVGHYYSNIKAPKIIGLTINTMKTKVMIQSRRDVSYQQTDILVIESVDSFTYLGTELTKGNEEEVE